MKPGSTVGALPIVRLLERAGDDDGRRRALRQQTRSVIVALAFVAALIAAWSANAPLAGAVVAPAQVRVEYKRKTVQHQEGGIVRAIHVRDGQPVHAGDALLVVGDTRREADLGALREQWLALQVRAARADAEIRFASAFAVPETLRREGVTDALVARERRLFDSRRQALDAQTALLQAQIAEAKAQVIALGAQIAALATSAGLSSEELALNERLRAQGFVSHARMLGLQRAVSDYHGQLGEAQSTQAAARQRIAELQSRAAQLRFAYQAQAADEAKEAAARVRELDERLRAANDQVERQIVRAPVDGAVMSLHVAAVGDVIGPREPLLDVVPSRERLVVDARIDPQDIEHVHAGGKAEVRLLTNDRTSPLLPAHLTFVSADRVTQAETGKSWFDVTAEVDTDALRQLPATRWTAGMPVELYVTTSERTLTEYLARPLGAFLHRAMREPG